MARNLVLDLNLHEVKMDDYLNNNLAALAALAVIYSTF